MRTGGCGSALVEWRKAVQEKSEEEKEAEKEAAVMEHRIQALLHASESIAL